ncbi:MAG TPA: amino acid adenylation domain-containing protein [Thermoanaerobaculia bacterium]|nr:amino acid adenylation domain-containing protein [Thermoanaerobaculia bacterium]
MEEIQPDRDLGGSPLFSVMLLLENNPTGALSLPGLALDRVPYRGTTSKLDLTLTLTEGTGGLDAQYEFDADLFDPPTMLRRAGRFAGLLAAVGAEPERPISSILAATPAEMHQTRVEWNDRPAPYDVEVCLHRLVEAQADRTPEALAVIADGAGQLTYAELEASANRLAHRLIGLGVRRGARVAIVVERSLDLIVAILGTQKAGAAYVPLDPSYPADRLAYLFADSKVAAVVAQERFVSTLPVTTIPIVRIDADAELGGQSAARPDVGSSPDDLAYVIYTSGSTGKPKGVLIPHRAIGNRIQWQLWAHPFAPGERLLQKTPTSFDASVWELFAPLAAGGVLVVAQPDGHRDAAYMARAIAELGVGTLQLVPSMLQVFVEEPELARCADLRRVFAGGEALPTALARRLDRRLGIPLHNLYGPTETAIDVASRPRVGEVVGKAISPIGRPLPNLRLLVLDRERRPVALGLPGELCVGGVNLAWGYLGRPDLTAEKFIPDATAAETGERAAHGFGPGSRLYRTGDLARFLADGEIEVLGRIDSQVKVRGFRIELGEIESRLREHPDVAQAVVIARSGEARDGADKRLVAYLVAREESVAEELSPRALKSFLARELPEHMVPADFVRLKALPTLPNGKLDLASLPAPGAAAASGVEILETAESAEAPPTAAPKTPIEEVLATIWAQVLGLPTVSVTDSFFDLGGHSLLALQVTSRARAAFGVPVKVRTLFEAPSVAQLARRIEAARAALSADAEPLPPLEPVSRDRPLPLSFAQERLWFLDRLLPGSPVYNLPIFLRFVGALSIPALGGALSEIVRRHEALRTTFVDLSGEGERPVQRIAPVEEVGRIARVRLVDLQSAPAERRGAEAERLAEREGSRPFDLGAGPLVRATMVRLDAADHVGLFNLHHSVSDDWSSGILVRELGALYGAAHAGLPSPLPDLAIQYADFSAWQREWLDGPALERRLAFWTTALAGAPLALDLPADRPRPPAQSFRGEEFGFRLAPEIESALRAYARGASASPFMVLFAAFATLLGRLAGVEDVLVGSPVAGRTRPEIEGLIGFFINTLVLRARPRPGVGFAALVDEARGTLLDAFAEQDLPFEKLVGELNPERDPSRPPIFSVNFSFQTAAVGQLELPGVRIQPWKGGSGTVKGDLALYLSDQGQGISGAMVYSTDLFDRGTIGRYAGYLETLLGAALADPARTLAELPLLAPPERVQIVAGWSRSAELPPAAPRTFAGMFEDSADRFGKLAAVALEDRELSYDELDARANRLAHHLRAFGVGPEVAVGVFCDPSFDLAVALLGIAKAGGVYVPLDPQLPLERLSYLIEDAGLAILLTQEHLQETLPALPVFAIVLDGAGWDLIAASPESRPEPAFGGKDGGEAALDSLAYVIYTSGSTGKPKGVGVSHRGVANMGHEHARLTALEPGDRVLQFASIGFDASLAEMANAWAAGATLLFAGREQRMPGPGLARLLDQQRVTLVTLPPSALAALPELPDGVPAALIVAGEACPPDLAERWRQGRRFVDAYGPTETTVCASALVYDGGRLTLGRPIAGFEAYVLDSWGSVQPLGVPGELLLGGAALARGYQGRPDLTAERFVPHPFAAEGAAGARLYRTGDLARWIAVSRGGVETHELEFLGRIDHQVKIRGFRIELGEIEAVLSALSGVREAVALARPAGDGDLRLVAYVLAAEPRPEPADLKEALRGKLPDYMVPAILAVLDDFPRNAAGKVDRRALAAIDPVRVAAVREYLAPQTDIEVVLAGIWCEVLDRERIGIDEDFFDIGGHSLLATKVVARVQKVFRIDLELRDFFAATTIEAAARALIAKEKQPGMAARTARLLRQIQGMSAEQRQALLAGTPAHEGAEDA